MARKKSTTKKKLQRPLACRHLVALGQQSNSGQSLCACESKERREAMNLPDDEIYTQILGIKAELCQICQFYVEGSVKWTEIYEQEIEEEEPDFDEDFEGEIEDLEEFEEEEEEELERYQKKSSAKKEGARKKTGRGTARRGGAEGLEPGKFADFEGEDEEEDLEELDEFDEDLEDE
ncbi:MAG: hypothetical protein ACTSU5_15525 [Promethearchaeota archaeon]